MGLFLMIFLWVIFIHFCTKLFVSLCAIYIPGQYGHCLDLSYRWFGEGGMGAFLAAVPRWVELGARMIGGCCRVGPQEIKLIKQRVDSIQKT